jgi:hypothetical protein
LNIIDGDYGANCGRDLQDVSPCARRIQPLLRTQAHIRTRELQLASQEELDAILATDRIVTDSQFRVNELDLANPV